MLGVGTGLWRRGVPDGFSAAPFQPPAPDAPPAPPPPDLAPIFAAHQGVWLDPNDAGSLFQETTGPLASTPAGLGDPVGTVRDLSGQGRHAVAPTDATRPILAEDSAGRRYLRVGGGAALELIGGVTLRGGGYAAMPHPDVGSGILRGSGQHRLVHSADFAAYRDDASGYVAFSHPITRPIALSVIRTATEKRFWRDGREVGAYAPSANPIVVDKVSRTSDPAVDFYGMVLTDAELSEADRVTVDRQLGLQCGQATWRSADPAASPRIVLCLGQSNMIGRADLDTAHPHPANVWAWDGALAPARSPLGHTGATAGDAGPDQGFAAAWTEANPTLDLVLVPGAQGGTGFATGHWRAGGAAYTAAVARTQALMAAQPDWTLAGILWAQGESDAGNGGYAAELDDLVARLRADLGVAPFVASLPAADWVGTDPDRVAVRTAIEGLPARVGSTAVASSAGLSTVDGLHFDTASLRTLGARMAGALATL